MVISMILHPHKFPRYYTTTYPGMLNCTGTSFSLLDSAGPLNSSKRTEESRIGASHYSHVQKLTCKSQHHEPMSPMMNMLEIITHLLELCRHYAMVHNVHLKNN